MNLHLVNLVTSVALTVFSATQWPGKVAQHRARPILRASGARGETFWTMNAEPRPTQAALNCASVLNGHYPVCAGETFCELCTDDASIMDAELLLPQKNAALLLAQAVTDAWDLEHPDRMSDPNDLLRIALSKIKQT